VTGSLFFAPSATFLEDVGDAEPAAIDALAAPSDESPASSDASPASSVRDTSLGIGSLKGVKHE
jgi:putative iron-dependent peroxidase